MTDPFAVAGWTILTGAIVASSCALLGCFLVLRRIAMLGDAISHAVLPGIAIAFILTSSRASAIMFVGAVLSGILTTFLVQALSRGGVQGDAAIGITFTSLFAIGVVLITRYGSSVDLDTDCVLYGEITYVPYDVLFLRGMNLGPRAVWINGLLLLVNLAVVALLYKQFKITAFDPELAAAVGIPIVLMHYLLMGLVAVTTVGAFESVGAILVVAMIIVPAATAYLLTERLHVMIAIAMGLGILSAVVGYGIARMPWLNCSIAGAMATSGGVFFLAAFLFSPLHGVVSRHFHHLRTRKQVAVEDILLWAGRRHETDPGAAFQTADVAADVAWPAPYLSTVLKNLMMAGMLVRDGALFKLSEKGRDETRKLLHRHRLYESYLDNLGYATDHLHSPTDRVEHYLSPALTERLDKAVQHPDVDPHGKPIPRNDT